jgi:hypothetical protein
MGIFVSPDGLIFCFDISSTIATIGASQISGSTYDNFLNGSMSNYCIYNKALTAQEIKQNYNNLKVRYT